MRRAAVVGVGMTSFGRYFKRSLRDLAGEAVRAELDDAGMINSEVQAAYIGNSVADAGESQVPNAKVGLAENAGDWVGEDTAAGTVHILAV